MRTGRSRNTWIGLLAIIGIVVFQYFSPESVELPEYEQVGPAGSPVHSAYANGQSRVWLETEGRVTRILSDDNEGSRHQRFVLDVGDGHTVLVAHNIDLAARAPVSMGDAVVLRGRYEWNERGGVIHWTHHDPDGRLKGGWIRHDDEIYK